MDRYAERAAVLTAALDGHDAGVCVIRASADGRKMPVAVPGYGKASDDGKRGAGWELFQTQRPDRSTVEQWFADGYGGMGIVCGAISGNLEMLELEGRAVDEGIPAPLVERAREAGIEHVIQRLIDGYYEVTPSGGRHFYYRVDGAPVPHNTKLAHRPATAEELAVDPDEREKVLIETRGEGGFSVAAPSNGATHPSGKPWLAKGGSLATIPTLSADERDTLARVCRSFDQVAPPSPPPPSHRRTTPDTWRGGDPGDSWMDAVEDHLAATTDVRTVLERHGWVHCYDDAQGRQLLRRPGKEAGVSASVNTGGRLYVFSTSTPFEVGPTTHSILDVLAMYEHSGNRQAAARTIADQAGILAEWQSRGSASGRTPPPNVDPDTGEFVHTALALPVSWSDAHVGEAFGVTLAGRWLYCRALGGWQQWDGRRWRTDPGEAVFEEFRQWIIALGDQIWRSDGDGELMKKVARYRERGKIDAAVTIARRLAFIAAQADEFDTHAHLLCCHNGVVDLRTGELGPHDPALRIRQLAGADYRRDATHPDIEAVTATIGTNVRPWVQRLLGSAAVGSVVDDIVAVFDGKGSNGKSTLLKAAASGLGDYATPASTRLLISRATHDEHPTLVADLFGRRLVYIEETPEGGALKMEQLKALSGGTEIKARFIARDQFAFTPTHQFVIATNHRPAVNASDYAAWRRLRLVPFPNTYRRSHEAQPGDLVADLELRGRLTGPRQREAMLAWIVQGAIAWHRHGLGSCAAIDEASAEWRRAEDVIEAWWADNIEVHPDATVRAGELYSSYSSWCERNGRTVSSNKEFVKKLTDHELYERHRIERRTGGRHGNTYAGFGLRADGLL